MEPVAGGFVNWSTRRRLDGLGGSVSRRGWLRRRTTVSWLLVLLAVVAPIAVVGPRPDAAHAHAAFISSQPRPGEELASAPGVVVLRFTEPINARLSRAAVIDPTGRRFEGTAGTGASGEQEIQVRLSTSAPGIYEVAWTTVSIVDGHTLRGSFQFGVRAAPAAGAEGETVLVPERADLLIAVARAAEYAALLVAAGMLLLRFLARRAPPLRWARGPLHWPLSAALAAGAIVITGEGLAASPTPAAEAVAVYLTSGLPGAARLLRVGAESLALCASILVPRLVAVPLAAAFVALAAAGHAAAVRPVWWGVGVDAAHLLAAGLWAGGILALATIRPPDGWQSAAGRRLLQRFSPVALAAFFITVASGALRGVQELGGLGDLAASSYGQVLSAKVLAVLAIVPLSFLAWRRRLVVPRAEGAIVVLVIGAAALLAAYPLPPARAGESDAVEDGKGRPAGAAPVARQTSPAVDPAREPAREPAGGATVVEGRAGQAERAERGTPGSALPQDGDLTLGGDAGEILVGLTLRPGQPGRNTVLLHLLPIDEAAAASLIAELLVQGQPVAVEPCGATCRFAQQELQGGERVEVRVPSEAGVREGTAVFDLPALPAPEGSALFERLQARMHALRTYRIEEWFGPAGNQLYTALAYQAPDRMRMEVSNGFQRVWVGETRYVRMSPDAPWRLEAGSSRLRVPRFDWDSVDSPSGDGRIVALRLVGEAQIEDKATHVVTFFMQLGQNPIWFRVWVDADGLVHRAEMRTQAAHFMDLRYYDFDAPFTIEPPVG